MQPNTVIRNNNFPMGGGVRVFGGTGFIMYGGSIYNNTSDQGLTNYYPGFGGGLLIQGRGGGIATAHANSNNRVTILIRNGDTNNPINISNNQAIGATNTAFGSATGGGIALHEYSSLLVDGPGTINISGNSASQNGGGISMRVLPGHSDDENDENMHPGRLRAELGGTGTINIDNNRMYGEGHPFIRAGGAGINMHIRDSILDMTGSNVNISNHTGNYGSGIGIMGAHTQNMTINMYSGTRIFNNTVAYPVAHPVNQVAGGVDMSSHLTAIFNMRGGSIDNNVGIHGGGVRTNGGRFVMESGATIRNNHAIVAGGGVFITATGVIPSLTMETGSVIEANYTAPGTGAGIHILEGRAVMNGGHIRNHNADAGRNEFGGTAVNGGTVNGGPSRGSAVSVVGNLGGGVTAWFEMHGGYITSNRTADPNMAGGVNLVGIASVFMFGGGTIGGATSYHWNQGTQGGGVRVGSGSSIFGTLPGPTERNITHNRAVDPSSDGSLGGGLGGGIYIGETTDTASFQGGFGTTNISRNSAVAGGGIYIDGGAALPSVNVTNGNFIMEYNTVSRPGAGAGIHQMGGTVTFQIGIHAYYPASRSIRNHTVIHPNHISSPSAVSHGSAIRIDGGTFNLQAGKVYNNITPDANIPGGMHVRGNGVLNIGGGFAFISDVIDIHNNIGTAGGGVRVEGNGTVNMIHALTSKFIRNNHATIAGGGIYVATTATSGTTGLHMTAGPIYIEANTVGQANAGAGIHQISGQTVMTSATAHVRRHNASGGRTAPHPPTDGSQGIANGDDTGAGGPNNGSGVWINGGVFTMAGGHITSNRTTLPYTGGGGVSVVGAGTVFTMTGGTIGSARPPGLAPGGINPLGNTAANGGGVAVRNNATFNMHTGGPPLAPTSGAIIGNTATGVLSGHGGAGVFVTGAGSRLEMRAGTITQNEAINGSDGGGVTVTLNAEFEMFDGTISHNQTIGSGVLATGGGVMIHGTLLNRGASFTMRGGLIHGNIANWSGGGINIHDADFTMTGGTVSDNTATNGNGGGIHFAGDATGSDAVIENGIITGNTTLDNNDIGNGEGGGIHLWNSALTMQNVTIQDNEAIFGGGISVVNSEFDMYGGLIGGSPSQGNRARYGGGMFVNVAGSVNLLDGANPLVIAGNRATVAGGGINITGGSTVTMQEGAIRDNYTRTVNDRVIGNGGGVNLAGASMFNLTGGVIENNIATRSGGGVYVSDGMFNMDMWYDWVTSVYTIPIIRGNTSMRSGGGVALYGGNAVFQMFNGIIENNGHPRMHPNPISGSIFASEEITTRDGGGVRVAHGATFEIAGSFMPHISQAEIRGNTANRGGGVNVSYGDSLFRMGAGRIGGDRAIGHGNTATWRNGTRTSTHYDDNGNEVEVIDGNGGGLFIGPTATGSVAIIGIMSAPIDPLEGPLARGPLPFGSIIGNTAFNTGSGTVDGGGGGVYVVADGWFDSANIYILDNHAPNGMGGGIFTELHEYADPLTRYDVADPNRAYRNLHLLNIMFGGNRAYSRHAPPVNADELANPSISTSNPIIAGTIDTSQPANTPHLIHPLNNYDINFLQDEGVEFNFIKTDHQLNMTPRVVNPLGGAQFRVFRVVDPSVALPTDDTGLVRFDSTGALDDARFEEITFSGGLLTSSATGYMTIVMNPADIIQLVEVVPPVGFAPPFGQWRISYDSVAEEFNTPVIIGSGTTPGFVNSDDVPAGQVPGFAPDDVHWYLANLPVIDLPLSGGTSAVVYTVAGSLTLGLGLAGAVYIQKTKNAGKRRRPTSSRA